MRAGALSLVAGANLPPRDKLPPNAQQMRTWALGQIGHVAATVNPFENEELASLRAERTKNRYPLGDMPLIVLTRGIADEMDKALEDEHRRDHETVAGLSRKGKLVIAEHSAHHVQLDEPELVVKSVREVLEALKSELRWYGQSRGTKTSAGQSSALRILTAVVSSTFVSPASIFCRLRILSPIISASDSWVMPLAIRSLRTLAPKTLSCISSFNVRGTSPLEEKWRLTVTIWHGVIALCPRTDERFQSRKIRQHHPAQLFT